MTLERAGLYEWSEDGDKNTPSENAIALAELPVITVYKYVENIIISEENGVEELYTGWIMEVLPNQKFLGKDYKHLKIIGCLNDSN